MSKLFSWCIDNSVAANLLMWVLIVGGTLSIFTLKEEIFPELDSDFVSVSVAYPGAAPEEVEEGICLKIEEDIENLEGIKQITSRAYEGFGVVSVELELDEDIRDMLDDIKVRVDAIDTFPEEAEKPIVQELQPKRQVINLSLYGDTDEITLKHLGEKVRDELLALPGISQVEIAAAKPFEIAIEVSEQNLRRYGLSFEDVAKAVQAFSVDLPGGKIKAETREILLRTKGQAYTGHDFEQIVLVAKKDGARLLLKDVATVVDGLAETDLVTRFNGKMGLLIQVFRVGQEGVMDIAAKVKKYAADKKATLPAGISIDEWQDRSNYLRERINLLIKNAILGIILVFFILALFLRLSLAFWVTLGLPISFLGTFLIMPELDVSINMISCFGFILVLGIVVDDAIIVGESVYSELEKGKSRLEAAITGTSKVAMAVIFAVFTSIAAFFALMSGPGKMGEIFSVISTIAVATFAFSLIESLFILPVHLAHDFLDDFFASCSKYLKRWNDFQSKFAARFDEYIEKVYKPALAITVRCRYFSVVVALSLLMVTFGFVKGGWIKFSFFPEVEADYVSAGLIMPEGTPAKITAQALAKLEWAAFEVKKELEKDSDKVFRHIVSSLGSQPFRSRQGGPMHSSGGGASQGHMGEVSIELVPPDDRVVGVEYIERRWRQLVGEIPGAIEVSFTSSIFSAGDDINIQIAGENFAELKSIASELKLKLAGYPGVFEITDSYRGGKREYKIELTREGEMAGLSLAQLGRQLRYAFYGFEAQRIQRDREEIKVMVRYPEKDRNYEATIENMRISLPDGTKVPFLSVARLKEGDGFSTITRVDRFRTISVRADVDESIANAQEVRDSIAEDLFAAILAKHPDIKLSFEGAQREQRDTVGGLVRGFLTALLIIYALMAVPLRSYFQPLIIMSAIPFGLIGAVIGHLVMGINLTILSIFGLVALTGVVVNDGLVLVSFINRARREDEASVLDAIVEGGSERFRPVLLTSFTTFAGLAPMMFETSTQAQFLIPVAVSLAFGVLFATFITLLLVPASYAIIEDVKTKFRRD